MKEKIDVKLSVVIVNYNGYEDTVACVNSIIKSEYKNFKIILVDNASDDKKTIYDDKFLNDNCDIIYNNHNLGFSDGNNAGIKYAKQKYNSEYFLLLNNDTVINVDTLGNLIEAADNVTNLGLMTGRILYFSTPNYIWAAGGIFDYNTGIADQPAFGKKNSDGYATLEETSFCTGCVMLITNEVIDNIGYLDDSYFMYAEDTDYCCRVMNAGYKLYYCGKAIVYHKVSASTGQSSNLSQYYNIRNNFYIIKRYCRYPLIGYGKKWYRIIRSIWKRELSIHNVYLAYNDFRRGIVGKNESIN